MPVAFEDADAICGDCGEPLDSNEVSIEAWERYGALVCDCCARDRFEEEGDE